MEAADFVETLALISHITRHNILEARSFAIHRLEELWWHKWQLTATLFGICSLKIHQRACTRY